MHKLNASVYLYIISGVLFFLSVILDNEILALVAKPIIIPSIVFYYFSQIKTKVNDLFILSLVLFFMGDMLYLINIQDYYFLGLFLFLFPYIIIIYYVFIDFKILLKKRVVKKIDISLIIVSLFLIYLIFSVINLLEFDSYKELIYAILFAIELFFMTVLTGLVFLYSSYRKNAYLAFAVLTFIVSDVFFMLDKHFFDLQVFKLVNAFAQTISYFFYVKYFIERTTLLNRVRIKKE